jgi:two-component system OmpR family response regulator
VRILLAEDDGDVGTMLGRALARDGIAIDVVHDGVEALWMASEITYDVIILDVNMPGPNGFDVCRRLRESRNWTPVIFLTGRGDVPDRITGLDAGADDYLVKPFSMAELHARLRAVGRRRLEARPTVLVAGSLEVDPATRRVRLAGEEVALTSKEFALVELLARHAGEVVTRSAIIDALYDFAYDCRSNVVESLVRRVRAKVDTPFGRRSIETVRGAGYRLSPD